MREVEAYRTVDGKLFDNEKAAIDHENDLIGEELNGLLMHVMKLDIERSRQFKAILNALDNKEELVKVINKLYFLLNDDKL